jgi:hypothetical protein
MIVDKYGTVVIDESNQIKVEGWLFHRDATDPVDAEDGEVLLGFVTKWALKKLQDAVAEAMIHALTHKQKPAKPN